MGWDRGFKSRTVQAHWYLVFAACCVSNDLCDELIARPEESYRCVYVFVCVGACG